MGFIGTKEKFLKRALGSSKRTKKGGKEGRGRKQDVGERTQYKSIKWGVISHFGHNVHCEKIKHGAYRLI